MLKKRVSLFCSAALIFLLSGVLTVPAFAEDILQYTQSAILIEASTGRIVFEKNATEQLPMASTTKIMTALLTLESGSLDEEFTVDTAAIQVEGTSMGLTEGSVVSKRDLCYGMLLASGNDAANAAAVAVAGSVDAFVKLMNDRAHQLGLYDTHFDTPSGLDGKTHHSTAYDMALLARCALANADFAEICASGSVRISYGNPPYSRTVSNHNRLLEEYEGCIGVKTGYTKKAGRCLVSAVKRDGITLICVTLNAGNDWNVHKYLYDTYFPEISLIDLTNSVSDIKLAVVGSKAREISVAFESMPQAPVSAEELDDVIMTVEAPQFLYAPIEKGQKVGEAVFTLNGFEICRVPLLAAEPAEYLNLPDKRGFFEEFFDFLKFWD